MNSNIVKFFSELTADVRRCQLLVNQASPVSADYWPRVEDFRCAQERVKAVQEKLAEMGLIVDFGKVGY